MKRPPQAPVEALIATPETVTASLVEDTVAEPVHIQTEPVEPEALPVLAVEARLPSVVDVEPPVPDEPLPEASASPEAADPTVDPVATAAAPEKDTDLPKKAGKAATPIMVPLPRGKARRPRAKS